MIWTDESDALLIRLWDEGGSLSYVAENMQQAGYVVSRNAIAGRRHRLRSKAFKRGDGVPAIKIAKKPVARDRPQRSKRKPMKTPSIVPTTIANNEGVDYLSLPNSGCKAILDKLPRSGPWLLQRVCGLPRFGEAPYCREHYELYTTISATRRQHG
jgi:hypothetical protein